jgi:hypothetical protein
MGVTGLTTFLREGRNALSSVTRLEGKIEQTELEPGGSIDRVYRAKEEQMPLVVDVWA